MANTYSQIYVQIIFSVQNHRNVITNDYKDELYKYITGIIRNNKCKVIAINGIMDHIHIFIGLTPSIAISDLVKEIKRCSTNFINDKNFTRGKFSWQEGFGAFSYSRSAIGNVVKYIENQVEHHKKKSFREEYIEFLNKYDVKYDPKYIFKEINDE